MDVIHASVQLEIPSLPPNYLARLKGKLLFAHLGWLHAWCFDESYTLLTIFWGCGCCGFRTICMRSLIKYLIFLLQAYKANVICPNKHQDEPEKFHNNRLLESETYIGGHVECLETGVFRSDLPTKFHLEPSAYEVEKIIHLPFKFLVYVLDYIKKSYIFCSN